MAGNWGKRVNIGLKSLQID